MGFVRPFCFLCCLITASPVSAQSPAAAASNVQLNALGKRSGKPFNAKFVDVAREAGLTKPTVYGGIKTKDYILESIGSGAAFLDYDNDGWIDIFIVSGTRLDDSAKTAANRLYRNNHDGTFREVTEAAGLERSGWGASVTVGDYDNDGNEDLFVTYWGHNVLYRNEGNGTFRDVTARAGVGGVKPRWGAGATFLDYDRDGYLDLFVSYYLKFDFETAPPKGGGGNCKWKNVAVYCGPQGFSRETPTLYRNKGDGSFEDVTDRTSISGGIPGYGMTAVAADFDADGRPDVYLASDDTPSLLFRNNHDGTFTEEGLERGVALSGDGLEQSGMGVGIGDYDADGDLDIFKTNFMDDMNSLYRNEGGGNFEDATVNSGLGVETRFVGWGAAIADLDNDAWPDLFYVTGNVYPELEATAPEYPHYSPRVVFRNLGGGEFEELIEEAGPGIAARHDSRGMALGDYDNDGDLDILIVNLNEPPSLLQNNLAGDHRWLKVRLRGTESNRSAIGALVTVSFEDKRLAQAVTAQSSFYSVNDRRLHFGLGTTDKVSLEVRWPSGKVETFEDLKADQLVTVIEGKGMEPAELPR